MVELQQANGRSPNARAPGNSDSHQSKMLAPMRFPRVIQLNEFSAGPVHGGNIGSFMTVAAGAGQRKVWGGCLSAVFLADNVIHLQTNVRVRLVNQAIFAKVFSPVGHLSTQPIANADSTPSPTADAPAL